MSGRHRGGARRERSCQLNGPDPLDVIACSLNAGSTAP
jgi:hypothetical protein